MLFTDQLNRAVLLSSQPMRIISLVPSLTELLVDLGLENKLIGITKFCVHPGHIKKSKTIVGGTKNYRFEIIDTLNPDLIIGNKEENDRDGIEKLAEKYPVWLSDIVSLEDNYQMIGEIGKITGTENRAEELIRQIRSNFQLPIPKKGTCIYLIWDNPILAAGKNTFIDALLETAGFENLINSTRYPNLDKEELQSLAPDFLLLSSEPYPFSQKNIVFFQSILPNTQIRLVDGELFSWYGSRLKLSAAYFYGLG